MKANLMENLIDRNHLLSKSLIRKEKNGPEIGFASGVATIISHSEISVTNVLSAKQIATIL